MGKVKLRGPVTKDQLMYIQVLASKVGFKPYLEAKKSMHINDETKISKDKASRLIKKLIRLRNAKPRRPVIWRVGKIGAE